MRWGECSFISWSYRDLEWSSRSRVQAACNLNPPHSPQLRSLRGYGTSATAYYEKRGFVTVFSQATTRQWAAHSSERVATLRCRIRACRAAPVAQGGAPGGEQFVRRGAVVGPRRVSVRSYEQGSGPVRRGAGRDPHDVHPVGEVFSALRATSPSSVKSRSTKRPPRISSYRRDSPRLASGTRWPVQGCARLPRGG